MPKRPPAQTDSSCSPPWARRRRCTRPRFLRSAARSAPAHRDRGTGFGDDLRHDRLDVVVEVVGCCDAVDQPELVGAWYSSDGSARISLRSCPALNDFPAAARTTTRTPLARQGCRMPRRTRRRTQKLCSGPSAFRYIDFSSTSRNRALSISLIPVLATRGLPASLWKYRPRRYSVPHAASIRWA